MSFSAPFAKDNPLIMAHVTSPCNCAKGRQDRQNRKIIGNKLYLYRLFHDPPHPSSSKYDMETFMTPKIAGRFRNSPLNTLSNTDQLHPLLIEVDLIHLPTSI
jgi:hypothetical protein